MMRAASSKKSSGKLQFPDRWKDATDEKSGTKFAIIWKSLSGAEAGADEAAAQG
jgi:hypothetical protein